METASDSVGLGLVTEVVTNDSAPSDPAGETESEYVQVLSDYGRLVFEIVNYVTISSVIGLFGICSNIVNIIIFVKHRFNESMTISLLGLSIADLIGLILLEIFNVCVNPMFIRSDIPFYPPEVQYITVGWPHVCFTRITCLITVFVAIERCLCIKVPLKVKMLLTPRRSFIVVASIYSFMMLGMIPTYLSVRIGRKYVKQRNRTLYGLIEAENREAIEAITIALNVFTQIVCFVGIIGSNAVLIHALQEKTKWRQTATGVGKQQSSTKSERSVTANTNKPDDASADGTGDPKRTKKDASDGGGAAEHATNRDKKLGRMIVLLSAVVFICYLPSTMCLVFMMIFPSFSIMGDEVNVFFMAWSWVFVFDSTNSSVNIFLYYNMSSKYRATFLSLFPWFARFRRIEPSKDTDDRSKALVTRSGAPNDGMTPASGGETAMDGTRSPQTMTTSDTKSSSNHLALPNSSGWTKTYTQNAIR